MATITKVEVLHDGVPLVGATVLVGELGGQVKETDEDGKVALPDIEASYAGYTEVLVQAPGIYASAKVVIEYGETATVNLGTMIEDE